MTHKTYSYSWATLSLVFIAALATFLVWRWDSEAWLQQRIDAQIQQQKLPVSYTSMERQGASIHFTQVHIHAQGVPPLTFDALHLQLAWSELWHGRLGIKVQASNAFLTCQSTLIQQGDIIQLQDLQLHADVAQAVAWFKPSFSLAQVHGQAELHGTAYLNRNTGLPASPSDITVTWNKAAITMMQQTQDLGDYTLSSQQDQQSIHWNIKGGHALSVQGDGLLMLQPKQPQNSSLTGKLSFKTQAGTLLSQLLGATSGKQLNITGTLTHPQWHSLR